MGLLAAFVTPAAAVATPNFLITASRVGSTSTNADFFTDLNSLEGTSTTEANVNVPLNFAFQITRVQMTIQTNTKNVAATWAFRDDGVDIGALTVTASTTGNFDSGALTDDIASGSQVNWRTDMSASASGAIGDGFIGATCHST